MSIQDIQDSIEAKVHSGFVQMSPLLNEVFESTFKKGTSAKRKSQDTNSADQSPSLNGRTSESQPSESSGASGSRHRTNDAAGSSSDQSTSDRGSLEQGQPQQSERQSSLENRSRESQLRSESPKLNRETNTQKEQEESHTPRVPIKESEQTPAGGSGVLGSVIRDAIKSSLQFRPLHIYPESINSKGKNPITGYDQPEIAPGIKLGKVIDY